MNIHYQLLQCLARTPNYILIFGISTFVANSSGCWIEKRILFYFLKFCSHFDGTSLFVGVLNFGMVNSDKAFQLIQHDNHDTEFHQHGLLSLLQGSWQNSSWIDTRYVERKHQNDPCGVNFGFLLPPAFRVSRLMGFDQCCFIFVLFWGGWCLIFFCGKWIFRGLPCWERDFAGNQDENVSWFLVMFSGVFGLRNWFEILRKSHVNPGVESHPFLFHWWRSITGSCY